MEERDPSVRKANFDALRRTANDREAARDSMRRAVMLDSLHEAAAVV
jgi:3-(3-hydroxy-phenyl)propionate hydroxylase